MMVGFTIQNLSPSSGPEEEDLQSQNVDTPRPRSRGGAGRAIITIVEIEYENGYLDQNPRKHIFYFLNYDIFLLYHITYDFI